MKNENYLKKSEISLVSIGMPVYNGEKFIRKRLDSILEQTFSDFELIISDNGSTDTTSVICKEYQIRDKRIRYIRQEKNMGITWNYNFVLKEAKCNYFIWAQVDDIWLPTFLEKNVMVLESNQNIVCSMCKIDFYNIDNPENNSNHLTIKGFLRKISQSIRPNIYPTSGTYDKKVRCFLKGGHVEVLYGLYRTKNLNSSTVHEQFIGNDWATVLSVLKQGDFHIISDILMHGAVTGNSSKGMVNLSRLYGNGILGIIFPWYYFTSWCRRNIGIKVFLKNLDFFIQLNLEGQISLLIDFIQSLKKIMLGK